MRLQFSAPIRMLIGPQSARYTIQAVSQRRCAEWSLRGQSFSEADSAMQDVSRKSQIIIAEVAGHIAGFAGSRGSHITWLFVHPVHRRSAAKAP